MPKKLFIIESLKRSDSIKTGSILEENYKCQIQTELFKCHNKEIFFAALSEVAEKSVFGDEIILSIEAHGVNNDGDYIGLAVFDENSDDEKCTTENLIIWKDLIPYLQKINSKVGMNLILLSSLCYGMYVNLEIHVKDAAVAPFIISFGPNICVEPQTILKYNNAIIEAFILNKNMVNEVVKLNAAGNTDGVLYQYVDCATLFKRLMINHYKNKLSFPYVKKHMLSLKADFEKIVKETKSTYEDVEKNYYRSVLDKKENEEIFRKLKENFLTEHYVPLANSETVSFQDCWNEEWKTTYPKELLDSLGIK